VTLARILALLAAAVFVVGLAATFGWTYRNQSRTVSRLERERAALRRDNRRLAASLASAQTALGTLNAGLAQTRDAVAAARLRAGEQWLDGYASGVYWGLGVDPYGAVDAPDAGSPTGYYGR
jgi:hypothetical protein